MNLELNLIKDKRVFIEFIKKEIVLIIAMILAIGTSFISLPKIEYIDFKVIILLFNLMILVAGFNDLKVLDSIATSLLKRCTSLKSLTYMIVFLTFFSAMIVTNDVALITFVPLTLIIGKKANINILKAVIFQTLAANLGSALTPMGNPQNLFIYSYFNINILEFLKITLPLVLLSVIFLIFIIFREKRESISFKVEKIKIENKRGIIIYSVLFFITLLSVFHLIDYRISFVITIISIISFNKNLFKKVDYSLLITFVAFFIFIGNISSMSEIKEFMINILSSEKSTFISSIISSQFISNVPATMLISAFTPYYKGLLLGVNIGGLGTIIASLASVISYKLYLNEYPSNGGNYIKKFTLYNILGLVIIVFILYFFI
ncbi:SLC13 family permease [Clostridium sp.]|jgi:Na+/H+ antiporter NhaD/arsenite permease-like protein|uniref:SLC13 family permease n=2 Tax=Clostridium TaxID=1485 RepID=UPI0025BD7366|nr:SLC13 family permease [Clostridium sp.]MCI9304534.1 anion transporter [Clostridium sp.]